MESRDGINLPVALGLRGRLVLLLLAVFAALAGVIIWYALDHRDERLRTATAELLAQARLIAQRQETLITRADALLGDLLHRQDLHPRADVAACSRVLAERLSQERGFAQIGWVLPNGDLACAAVRPQTTVNIADSEWFQQALKSHDLVISNIVTSRVVPGPVIVIARALRDAGGQVEGVLRVALDLAWLRQEVAGLHLPHGGRLSVLDAAGAAVVRHPDPEGWTGRNLAHLPHVKHILAATAPGTLDILGADGIPRLYAFVPLLNAAPGHLHLLLTIPRDTVTAPIYRELAQGVATMLAVLLAALAFGTWGGNRLLLHPLLVMSRTAQRFSAGDFSARSGLPHTDDDIGRLARTLDETAAAIEDRERRLAYANLGATQVQQLATELDAAFKAGADAAEIERLAAAVEALLQPLAAAILAVVPGDAPSAAADVDWATVRRVLAQLEPLLAASRMEANALWENNEALLMAALGPVGTELKQRIESFEYSEAMSALKQARGEHPELAS